MNANQLRIAIADDHRVFAQGLATLINNEGMRVVAMTTNRDRLLEIAVAHTPDVIIVDLSMPGIGIVELLKTLQDHNVAARLLVLTGNDDAATVTHLLAAGVPGYLLKDDAFNEITVGIRAIAAGESFVSSPLAARLLCERNQAAPDGKRQLTPRQLEILRLVADGDTSKRIARKLGLHVKTVDNHRDRIRQRLKVHSSAEMIRVASEQGLLTKELDR